MQKSKTCIIWMTVALILISGYSFGQTIIFEGDKTKEEKTWGSYLVSGAVGMSYLFDDIQGDKNLFLSQFNLDQGVSIPEISFRAYRDPEKNAFLDIITLDVTGFGAERYGRAAFRLEKRNSLFLAGGYTERKYFADVASFANPIFDLKSEEALYRSFHTWDTKEKVFDLSGGLRVTSWLSFDALWQRTELEGDSLITLHLLNNEFPLSEPINQTSNLFRLSADLRIQNFLFYKISGISNTFKLNQTTSSDEDNVGIRGLPSGYSTIMLTEQSRTTAVDLDTWVLDQSLQIVPADRLYLEASYKKSQTEGTSSGDENIEGRFVWPLLDFVNNATFMNAGNLKKDFDKADAIISFDLLPQLRLRAGYDYYKYKIDNSDSLDVSYTRERTGKTYSDSFSFSPLIQMKYDRFYAEADLTIGTHFTAGGGYAHSKNNLDLKRNDEEVGSAYKLNSYYANLGYKFSTQFSIKATFKMGDYDKVFTRAVPLKAATYGLQSRLKLNNGLSSDLFFKYQKLENSAFNYSSSFYGYGGNLRYQTGSGLAGALVHVSKNDLDSTMDIVRYVSTIGEIEDISKYTSDTTHIYASLWFRKGIISLDGGYSYSKNNGTFPIKMEFPYISLGVKIVSDLAITFNYRYINHNQELFASQDYKAHLFDVGFMYTY